jgi:DNA-binding transcriptional regulator YiaG
MNIEITNAFLVAYFAEVTEQKKKNELKKQVFARVLSCSLKKLLIG